MGYSSCVKRGNITKMFSSFRVHCARCIGHSPPLRTTAGNATTARQFFCLFVFLSFCLFLRYLLLKMENAIFFKTIDLYIDISMKVILKQNKMVCINF